MQIKEVLENVYMYPQLVVPALDSVHYKNIYYSCVTDWFFPKLNNFDLFTLIMHFNRDGAKQTHCHVQINNMPVLYQHNSAI